MPFAPTRNNRVAPRKRTLTSPTPTVKDGMVRRRRPATLIGVKDNVARVPRSKPPVGTPMSAPSVKTGTVRPPRPQARVSAKTIKVEKQPFIGVKASPLRVAKKNQKKSR